MKSIKVKRVQKFPTKDGEFEEREIILNIWACNKKPDDIEVERPSYEIWRSKL